MIKQPDRAGYKRYLHLLIAIAAGCAMIAIPFVGTIHIDSAILVGVIGAWAASWLATRKNAHDRDVLKLTGYIYIAAIPIVFHDLWTGCFSGDGIAYWIFIPSLSTLFGYSFGRAVRYLMPAYASWISISGIILLTTGGWLAIFFLNPQLYFFNHVFGFWPGPIYDESVIFTEKLIRYRIITITWIGILWLIPHLGGSDRIIKSIFLLLIMFLGINYAQSVQHGIFSPVTQIRNELKGTYQTDHFDIYYSKMHYDSTEIAFIGQMHEFHYTELTDILQVERQRGKRIESYLYGHAWQMQDLTGAKGVSFVPVWLRNAQLHIHKSALDRTLRHELVHVVARTFGNSLINASWNIGLVEGLAVALSPASSTRLTSNQLVVSNDAYLTEPEIRKLFSMTGFYRQSSSVAYGVSGSFVQSLLEHYPVDLFKSAYRYSSLNRGYGDQLASAIERWHEDLATVRVTDDEKARAERLFQIPSIFDTKCPRKTTKEEACKDAAARAQADSSPISLFGIPDKKELHDWLQQIVENPIDKNRFEEYLKAVYLLAFFEMDFQGINSRVDADYPHEGTVYTQPVHLVRKLMKLDLRPAQQLRLDEAYRFAKFTEEHGYRVPG